MHDTLPHITSSYIAWDSNDDGLIGDGTKNQATTKPENTMFDVKSMIGRSYKDKYDKPWKHNLRRPKVYQPFVQW